MTLDEVGLEAEQNALKLIEKDRELEALRLDYARGEGGCWRWLDGPEPKIYIYKKAAIDAILKNTSDMIKASRRARRATPATSGEEEDGQRIWRSPRSCAIDLIDLTNRFARLPSRSNAAWDFLRSDSEPPWPGGQLAFRTAVLAISLD
ncbi:hypothetical protein FNV43_RR01152 [Rhamnella rubrinervis]|uniref:Uncharacterized protein n=1 Tax=Rhamnella rubrinervis TaxID=2594499 RepID=A0A8K0MT26_9ROSA|nr:hypothetical protein FNV43_RR01152 [Rhamnella rubrinervis]